MTENRYFDEIPDGVTLGCLVSFTLGWIPGFNFVGAYLGGATMTYMEMYGVKNSATWGGLVGLVSVVPSGVLTLIVLFLQSSPENATEGLLFTLFNFASGAYMLFALVSGPLSGALGALTLGFIFHLIYKATDADEST